MKSGEELYNKVYESPSFPRKAVLKPNLHHGRQDLSNFEARTSVDHQSKDSEEYGKTRGEEFGETRSGDIDFRIQGLPHSTVQKEDDVRRETVKKLIHRFETHPNRESLMADLDKNQNFNLFNEKSKELIRSVGNTECFEMFEITSKVQCQDCLSFWETGIVNCTCGKSLQPSDRNRQLNKDRYVVLSIPNYVIEKGPSHGARHGPTERQRIYHKAHNTLRMANEKGYKFMLAWFLNSPRYRDSLTNIGCDENTCAAYDAIASKDHSYVATRWERSRNENSWQLVLNSEVQMDQWISAMTTKKQKRLVTSGTEDTQQLQDVVTQEFILENKFNKDQTNNSMDLKRILIELIQKLDGNIIFLQQPLWVLLLHHPWWRPSDSWWTAWNWDSSSWNEQQFFSVPDVRIFRLQEVTIAL